MASLFRPLLTRPPALPAPLAQAAAPLALLALVAPLAGCSPAGPGSEVEDPGAVVATLNGDPIHESDLDAWIHDELWAEATRGKDDAELHEWKRELLGRMIEDQLIAGEAEQRGVSVEDLQQQVVGEIAISDEEVQSFFAQNQERLGGATIEQIGPRIREFLQQQTAAQEWSRFVDGLRDRAQVAIELEQPRFEVEPVGPVRGPDDAPVTIVTFSDFNCPFCQRVNPTLEALRARYPDQVRIVFRHFPLDRIHPRARPIAEAAVCAQEQGLFWEFHDAVFADGSPLADDAIRATAEASGLDLEAFDACLSAGRAQAVVARDLQAGEAAGVTGTPAFFVNGIRLSGAQPLDAFVQVVEQELAREGEASS
jgi:protein-disulfide isomerase